MKVNTESKINEFMAQLVYANIEVPENLAINLTSDEMKAMTDMYSHNFPGTYEVKTLHVQFGKVNINIEK